jgi:NgoFVII restriction endonuclease
MFLNQQPSENQQKYFDLLKAFGALSKLFSENDVPYLYYRAHENIFCKALGASNESRGDVAVDAVKDGVGIGLKTFIFKPSQFEKVAEFNKAIDQYSQLQGLELAQVIAHLRNERILVSNRLYEIDTNIYHCVARAKKKFIVYEVDMPLIDIKNITGVKDDGKMVHFTDGLDDYKFNRSKSTLFKKFIPQQTHEFSVDVIADPYEAIKGMFGATQKIAPQATYAHTIILPLYSSKSSGPYVPERSGLNQWNAQGRVRADNEVYIPVPAWIHKTFPDFFPNRDEPFDLQLPSGKYLNVKICQDGGKALMSNPNADLGEWLLRNVLALKPGELLTYQMLQAIGIDSVAISKTVNGNFEIDFKNLGTYEKFKSSNDVL